MAEQEAKCLLATAWWLMVEHDEDYLREDIERAARYVLGTDAWRECRNNARDNEEYRAIMVPEDGFFSNSARPWRVKAERFTVLNGHGLFLTAGYFIARAEARLFLLNYNASELEERLHPVAEVLVTKPVYQKNLQDVRYQLTWAVDATHDYVPSPTPSPSAA